MSDLMQEVVEMLEAAEDFIVPARQLYHDLERADLIRGLTVDAFIETLRSDGRFRLFEASDDEADDALDVLEGDAEMEAMGFYGGPRVMLRDRMPTREDVLSILVRKADKTFSTLQKAWDVRPDGDEETEDQLLDALAKAQRLKRELQSLLDRVNGSKGEDGSDRETT